MNCGCIIALKESRILYMNFYSQTGTNYKHLHISVIFIYQLETVISNKLAIYKVGNKNE